MGEMADDMIDGSCCSECGQYFQDTESKTPLIYVHGYPVLCWSCWDENSELPKAEMPTF